MATAAAVLACIATGAEGQRNQADEADQPRNTTASSAQMVSCAPNPAARGATITFGHEGGSLRPRTVALFANGVVRAGSDSATDSLATLRPEAVSGLARLARTGGFWTLRAPAIRRPPHNPDVARAFIAVTLTCGTRRAEYVMGEPVPAAFAELQALLDAVTGPQSGR